MRPRHAVVLTFPIADSRPSWSYLQAGTLPRLISFVCHSCENCRVCTQNSHSETLSPEFANLPSTKLHGGVGRFFRSVHSAFTYPFFRWPELANRPGRLSHAPLQVSIEEDPGPAETVDCQPPLHRFPRVTGHRSRVSDHASFSSSLLTSLPHYFLAPSSLSPLDATLIVLPASVANKRLTVELNLLDATLTKNRGVGAPPFGVVTPIPGNVSNVFPIYPLCFHILIALAGSTALEQLFSNQPVTHSFRRDGGCTTPSRPPYLFRLPLSTATLRSRTSALQQGTGLPSATSHPSRVMPPPVHNSTVDYTLPHVYCPRAILPSLRPWDRPLSRRSS